MDSIFTLDLKTDQAKARVRSNVFQTVLEVFEIDIKGQAKENSPVKTGHNRRTIDTEVEQLDGKVKAQVFSQSGYGGYLELGTSRMKARPYMGPAFFEGLAKIYDKLRRRNG